MSERGEVFRKIVERIHVPKDQRNTFADFDYRSNSDILAVLKPILREFKCVPRTTDRVEQRGNYVYQVATVSILDEGLQPLTDPVEGWAREDDKRTKMDFSQLSGSASSYAAKRAWGNLLGIDDEKDSDATNVGGIAIASTSPPFLASLSIQVCANKKIHDSLQEQFNYLDNRNDKIQALEKIVAYIDEVIKLPKFETATLAALNDYFKLFLTTIHDQEMNKLQKENPDATQQQLFEKAEKAGLKPKMVSHTKIKEDKKESKKQEPEYVKPDTSYL